MNAQLKYADKRMSRCAVIQGSNERDAPGGPQVTIRDLKLGAELAKSDQGPRRLSRIAPARPVRRARGRAGRASARGAGAGIAPIHRPEFPDGGAPPEWSRTTGVRSLDLGDEQLAAWRRRWVQTDKGSGREHEKRASVASAKHASVAGLSSVDHFKDIASGPYERAFRGRVDWRSRCCRSSRV